MAFSFDWSREIDTTDPAYYKWTQWIFIQLFKRGLAYKKAMPINWCPSCKIGLANEEVIKKKHVDVCERCGTPVERRQINQWIVKITKYADRLINGLKKTDFIEKVKAAQINWIGKSEGIIIDYPCVGTNKTISCYSTRPDTNFGATFVVIAPEHPRVAELTTKENEKAIRVYIQQAKKKSELERTELEKEKTGVFTGSYALNRLTGRKMPIWIADFVVLTAGTGMVVGVPAHDERDHIFAQKYGLEIIPVVKPKNRDWDYDKKPFTDIDDAVIFNSDFLSGLPVLEAKEKIIDYLAKKKWGKRAVNYHLRDWIFSRQHYWGEPIPMIYCQKCGWQPVKEEDLPIELPQIEKYEPTDTGESPLAKIKDWVDTKCPQCGGAARRETDTMPNWAGSDWYYLAYCFANKLGNSKKIEDSQDIFSASKNILSYWLPVDVYIGGDEHNTLHLLYSRFIYQFLHDIGVVPKDYPEPYYKRVSHGVILGADGRRMSKSRGNIISPDKKWEQWGVDALRMYLMFMGPFEGTMAWNEDALKGVVRFLGKFQRFVKKSAKNTPKGENKTAKVVINRLIKKVTEDIDSFQYNTAIAAMMKTVNKLVKSQELKIEDLGVLVRLIAPFAPYLAEELWCEVLENKFSVHQQLWPTYDKRLLVSDMSTIVVQVNGRLRAKIDIESNIANDKDVVILTAKQNLRIKRYLAGKKIRKIVFVPGRLVNFVVK